MRACWCCETRVLSAGTAAPRPARPLPPARRLWRGATLALLLHVAVLLAVLAWFRAVHLPAAPEPPAVALITPPRAAAPAPVKPPKSVPAASLPLPPPPAPLLRLFAAPPRRPPSTVLRAAAPAAPISLAAPVPFAPPAAAGPSRPARPAGTGNTPPIYPSLSRVLGEQGRVRLEIRVTAAGTAAGVVVAQSSGFTRLDNAALAAAARWRFQPALQNGRPTAAVLPLWITFRLQ